MAIEANFNVYRPLLMAYSFENGDREKICTEVKKKLQATIPIIPLSEARVEMIIADLLDQLHRESYLLRRKLAKATENQVQFYVKQLKKRDKGEIPKAKVLQDWQNCLLGTVSTKDPKGERFCSYAEPLVSQMAARLQKKRPEELGGEIFKNVVEDIPAVSNSLWGEILIEACGFVPLLQEQLKPIQNQISSVVTSAVAPYRDSCHVPVDDIVVALFSKVGQEEERSLDRKKIKELLAKPSQPIPHLEKRLNEQIQLTADLTHRLLVEQVPQVALPWWLKWVPFKQGLTKAVIGENSTPIQELAEKLLSVLFSNPYVNVNRVQEVAARLLPRLDKAIK